MDSFRRPVGFWSVGGVAQSTFIDSSVPLLPRDGSSMLRLNGNISVSLHYANLIVPEYSDAISSERSFVHRSVPKALLCV